MPVYTGGKEEEGGGGVVVETHVCKKTGYCPKVEGFISKNDIMAWLCPSGFAKIRVAVIFMSSATNTS